MQEERPKLAGAQDPDEDDGVDVSLIRSTLSLTVQEQLELLERNAAALARLAALGERGERSS